MEKIKIDIIFQYNLLPVYFDNETKVDNLISQFIEKPENLTSLSNLMETLNELNENEFVIKFVSIDLEVNRIAVFSEMYFDLETQATKTWFINDLTQGEQDIINIFINLV